MHLGFQKKPYSFSLQRSLRTFRGSLDQREGWLLRIEHPNGQSGWGEVSPFSKNEKRACEIFLDEIGPSPSRQKLEEEIVTWPGPLAFGVGAALAELDGLVGSFSQEGWLSAPESAFLLPHGSSLFKTLESVKLENSPKTFKLKVAISSDRAEVEIVKEILSCLPSEATLRIDANGGWNRKQARDWGERVLYEPRIQWIEQPLRADDFDGLWDLVQKFPIALDESLLIDRSLIKTWPGWQVRRPLLEGDPRLLLQQLQDGLARVMISTAFETGIGRRWVNHLAALQLKGPTPTAPGLAPGWCPEGSLFSSDPIAVWNAA